MTRDYAKRPRRRWRYLKSIAVIAGLVLFLLTFLCLKAHLLHPHHKITTPKPLLPHPAAITTTPQPQFDFYKLLPKMQVTNQKRKKG